MMLDINTIDSDISKIDVTQLRRMITMENKVFEDMYRLILYITNIIQNYLELQVSDCFIYGNMTGKTL